MAASNVRHAGGLYVSKRKAKTTMGTIKVTLASEVTNGTYLDKISVRNFTITQTGKGASAGIRTIPTSSPTSISLGDVTDPGMVYLVNISTSGVVTYGPEHPTGTTMVPHGSLNPNGEFAWYRMVSGSTLMMQADTVECQVDVRIYQN